MLTKISLKNFKCYKEYEASFSKMNLLIGKNNNGKSTLIDAIKLIGEIINIQIHQNRVDLGLISSQYQSMIGFTLNEDRIPFRLNNLRHNYNQEEVSIVAYFGKKDYLTIIFPEESDICYYFFSIDKTQGITKNSIINESFGSSLGIMPVMSVFDFHEKILTAKYVEKNLGSNVSSRHFRNIWNYFNDDFEEFKNYIVETWEGVTDIKLPEEFDDELKMFITENNIEKELSYLGSGMMIWMQILMYLTKFQRYSGLVLDEPDVYLHSDLQVKLIKILYTLDKQVILTSHSVDIINEMEPNDILYIDKSITTSKRLKEVGDVQREINKLGSTQNIQIARIISSKKCLFIEGKDFKLLKKIANKFGESEIANREGFIVQKLEGFSNHKNLKDSGWYFENIIGEKIDIFVLLDKDYFSDKYLNDVKSIFDKNGISYHIWIKKEIENFLLIPEALHLTILQNRKFTGELSYDDFVGVLMEISETFRHDVHSQLLSRVYEDFKNPTDIAKYNKNFDDSWKELKFRFSVISGKNFLNSLNSYLNDEHGFGITINQIIHNLPDIDKDVKIFFSELKDAFSI